MRWSGIVASVLVAASTATAQSTGKSAPAALAGVVVDSALAPIANAEIEIPGLTLKTTSNDKGRFRIDGIPAGIHRVTVRRIGFASLDSAIIFPEGQTVERRVMLTSRIVTLDSIVAEAPPRDPVMLEFEENRKRGFGRFLGDSELKGMSVRPLGFAVQQLQGLQVMRGNTAQGWILGSRAPASHCPLSGISAIGGTDPRKARADQEATDECLRRERLLYVPDASEVSQGMKRGCYAVVYLDRHLMNSGRPTPPFNLNEFVADQLVGFEWYADAAQAPAQYAVRDAQCGVAILHLRKKQ